LATIGRRPEAYHRKVLAGANSQNGNCASIHDRVVFKQKGLEQRVQYDDYLRKRPGRSFLRQPGASGRRGRQQGGAARRFHRRPYEARIRRQPGRIQVMMSREGHACGVPLRITKGLTMNAGCSTLEIAYLLEGLPADRRCTSPWS